MTFSFKGLILKVGEEYFNLTNVKLTFNCKSTVNSSVNMVDTFLTNTILIKNAEYIILTW
jgi:hypothetical protein